MPGNCNFKTCCEATEQQSKNIKTIITAITRIGNVGTRKVRTLSRKTRPMSD